MGAWLFYQLYLPPRHVEYPIGTQLKLYQPCPTTFFFI